MSKSQREDRKRLLQLRTNGDHELKSVSFEENTNGIYTIEDAINEMGLGTFQLLLMVFCGLTLIADTMEILVLAIVSPAVKCQWNLSDFEEAIIVSIVFFGFFLGSIFWGFVCDNIGRRNTVFIVNVIVLVFGVLSALKVSSGDSKIPGYPWLIICRFCVGFGAGGVTQGIIYFIEFLPLKWRGAFMILTSVSVPIGSMFGAGLAAIVMGEKDLGWHWYLGLVTLPIGLVVFFTLLLPESARFYLLKGKNEKAQKVMKRIAWCNCKKLPPGRLVSSQEKERLEKCVGNDGNIEDVNESNSNEIEGIEKPDKRIVHEIKDVLSNLSVLFIGGMWRTTIILIFLWFGNAWAYYGIVLLTTSLLDNNTYCSYDDKSVSNWNNDSACDDELDTDDYIKILWSASAELPGLACYIILIEVFGRKWTMVIGYMGSMVAFLLLLICYSEALFITSLLITRASIGGTYVVLYIYTPEVYPTSIRALGLGVCTATTRIGAGMTSFVAYILLDVNAPVTFLLYASSCLMMAVLALMLTIETKGRALENNERK